MVARATGEPTRQSTDTSTGHPIPVAFDTKTETNAANRDYAQPVFAALDGPFARVTSGFAGAPSDGLTQLDASRRLTTVNDSADTGNIVQVAEVKQGRQGTTTSPLPLASAPPSRKQLQPPKPRCTATSAASVRDYEKGWERYDKSLNRPPRTLPGLSRSRVRELADAYYLNINVVKAAEDKTFPGAIVAGLSSPWGQAVSAGDPNNTYFGSYREVFARDLYEAWTGLMAAGDLTTARDATLFLFERQQLPDGSMPRNSLVNGKTAPDSFNTQLDEVAYPILMARSARPHRSHVVRAAHQAGSQLRGHPWPVVRPGTLGGAIGVLAVDDRRRDRRIAGRR